MKISKKVNPKPFDVSNLRSGQQVPIGVVAQRSGCGIETIRFYERAGVLPRAQRTESGRRIYDGNDVARITFIRRARDLGFSLNEVRSLLALAEGNNDACETVQAVARNHLVEIAAKIADLTTMQTVLGALVVRCEQGGKTACPLIAALSDDCGGDRLQTTNSSRC